MAYWVYVLYSQSQDIFYKGQTNDLERRLFQHRNGYSPFSSAFDQWILIWSTCKPTRAEAAVLERKLKNLSRERTIKFIKKYIDGVAGPDAMLLLQQWSG